MSKSLRSALRLLAIAAAITVVSFAFLHRSPKSETGAAVVDNEGGSTPASTCANTACDSACWADGTHANMGTVASSTPFSPPECGGGPGCKTDPCPCANTACNGNCWSDGTHANTGTVAVHEPNGCGGAGRCSTQSCF